MKLNEETKDVLDVIDDYGFKEEGAHNLRLNGHAACRGNSKNVTIVDKEDLPGVDIFVSGETDGEEVHIPVIVSESGKIDVVYNDFYVADGADVTIIAGCGIHNNGCGDTQHDGIHSFHIGKNCKVKYVENHYGAGTGTGERILNPVTNIFVGENSSMTLDTAQIKGVDSTKRETNIELQEGAKLNVMEKLMTHDDQNVLSDMTVKLNGENSSARIISRSVAKGTSKQIFHPIAVGSCPCHAHVQCDSIIMDEAEISSIPEINAKHVDAQIVHEAAIGRINNEQLVKLQTFGLSEEEAEAIIIETFLN